MIPTKSINYNTIPFATCFEKFKKIFKNRLYFYDNHSLTLYTFLHNLLKFGSFVLLINEVVLVLTTPVPQDKDIVLPGENWFLYWNTASSLWDLKLKSFRQGDRILVPINWSFHSETGDDYDFGDNRPETDLKKLVSLAEQHSLKVTFLLPLSPVPFIVNGGVPHLLARSRAMAPDTGLYYAVPDGEERIYGLYSFFDNRIFKAFGKFCSKISHYFEVKQLNNDIFGLEACYFEKGYIRSYFSDCSQTFDQAFSKFLKVKKNEENLQSISFVQEIEFKNEFETNIKEVYIQTASEFLNDHWEGVKKIVFVGGGSDSLFHKICGTSVSQNYLNELFKGISFDGIPSSILIPSNVKDKIIGRVFEQVVSNSLVPINFTHNLDDEDGESTFFNPMCFFKVKYKDLDSTVFELRRIGLSSFVDSFYQWGITYSSINQIGPVNEGMIYIFSAKDLDEVSFKKVLNLFINGAMIFFNKDNMDSNLEKRWNLFVLENNLDVEAINFHINVSNVSLGDGRFILFSGKELENIEEQNRKIFWEKIISTFSIKHLLIDQIDGVNYFWKTRKTFGNELKYEEVRRLSLYNVTSYKKRIKIPVEKSFKIIKFVDEKNSTFKVNQNIIDIEMLPDGSLSMDLGLLPS